MEQMIKDEQTLVNSLGAMNPAAMMTPQVMMSQLILSEFRNFRDVEWRDFRAQATGWREDTAARLVKAELTLELSIVGTLQPSRLTVAENSIEELKKFKLQALALVGGFGALFSAVAAFVGWYWPRR
jgi:hypothetical protein